MSNNKVLFIVEGESDEVRFLKQLYAKCFPQEEFEVYSYKTNIHILAQLLYNEYPDFEEDEIDIRLVLRSIEDDEYKKNILSQMYRDVYLIFDFDPQHDNPHYDTVRRMLAFFNDSTNHGKLYINYPMMQSYKHFSMLPDDDFAERKVNKEKIANYKKIVGDVSGFTDLTTYTYFTFTSLAVHHIKKANSIAFGKYILPSVEAFEKWDPLSLFDKQVLFWENNNEVYVVNTCIFILIEYAPCKFFRSAVLNRDRYDI